MRVTIIAAVLAASVLSGCASVTTGHNQSVSVETSSCPAASCKLTNSKGTWYVTNTPGSVTVRRAYGDMTVACEKNDSKAVAQFKSSTKAMAFGNIILGGVIGAGVDIGTGAAYDYPNVLSVDLKCGAAAPVVAVSPVTQPEAIATTPVLPNK